MKKTTYAIGHRKVGDKCITELVEINEKNNLCSLCSRYYSVYVQPTKKEALNKIKEYNKMARESGNLFEGY